MSIRRNVMNGKSGVASDSSVTDCRTSRAVRAGDGQPDQRQPEHLEVDGVVGRQV